MRYFLTILILIFISQSVTGQDIIQTKDKKQLNVRVIEQSDKLVKYKMSDYEDGPVISINANRISRIEYKNGFIDLMGNNNPRKNKPLGISGGLKMWVSETGSMVSSTVDYFINPQIDLEASIITDMVSGYYFCAGSRIHFTSNDSENKLSPFSGILLGSQFGDAFLQVPLGVNYLTKTGLNTSVSLNEMLFFNGWKATTIELRAGWRFKLHLP